MQFRAEHTSRWHNKMNMGQEVFGPSRRPVHQHEKAGLPLLVEFLGLWINLTDRFNDIL
jgi:hypothetical protein